MYLKNIQGINRAPALGSLSCFLLVGSVVRHPSLQQGNIPSGSNWEEKGYPVQGPHYVLLFDWGVTCLSLCPLLPPELCSVQSSQVWVHHHSWSWTQINPTGIAWTVSQAGLIQHLRNRTKTNDPWSQRSHRWILRSGRFTMDSLKIAQQKCAQILHSFAM